MAIFGNKSDLIEDQKVEEEKVREYAKEVGAIFARTSAKTGNGVNDSINKLVSTYLKRLKESPTVVSDNADKSKSVKIENTNEQNGNEKKKCCGGKNKN